MRLQSSKMGKRHPLWSKETLLADLKVFGTIKATCQYYATPECGWFGLYSDVYRWRNRESPEYDPAFAESMSEWVEENARNKGIAGRQKLVSADPDWRDTYRKALVANLGNRVKAAKVTPYTFQTLHKMRQEGTSEYDKELVEAELLADLELSSFAEESTHKALVDLVENPNGEQAKVSQSITYIATKVTEKLDKKRWGREQTLNVKGTVNHRMIPATEAINALLESQRKLFQRPVAALPAPQAEVLDVIDAELVHPENS